MSKLAKKITPLLLILSLNTLAADNSVLTYISTDSGTEITGCVNSCPTNIEIPSTINETTVTSIGQSAFEGATLPPTPKNAPTHPYAKKRKII